MATIAFRVFHNESWYWKGSISERTWGVTVFCICNIIIYIICIVIELLKNKQSTESTDCTITEGHKTFVYGFPLSILF